MKKETLRLLKKAVSAALVKSLLMVTFAIFATTQVLNYFEVGRDSTDGKNRSGMRLHVDNETGCEYLSAVGGGIAPRLDANGLQMGCK